MIKREQIFSYFMTYAFAANIVGHGHLYSMVK